jgi:hypothetical protein
MLAQIIALLSQMEYDHLKDWIDYIEYHHYWQLLSTKQQRGRFRKQVRSRRMGIPSGGFPYQGLQVSKKVLTMTRPAQQEAENLYLRLSKKDQTTLLGKAVLNRDVSGTIAWALLKSKAPVRKNSRGNIQVKWIPYDYIQRDDDGLPELDEDGTPIIMKVKAPFLYLRYYQVHGDDSKRKSRKKSVYIGGDAAFSIRMSRMDRGSLENYAYPYRALARLFWNTLQKHGIERSRNTQMGIQYYKVRPKGDENPIAELEQRIMACIDMDKVDAIGSAAIDHQYLSKLQEDLCGFA